MLQWVTIVAALLSGIAACLAWIAKIRWAKEFSRAKDAQIDAIKSELEFARSLTPARIREQLIAMRQTLEEQVEFLQAENEKLKSELHSANAESRAKLENLDLQHVDLIQNLQDELNSLKRQLELMDQYWSGADYRTEIAQEERLERESARALYQSKQAPLNP